MAVRLYPGGMGEFGRPGDVFLADCPARLAVEIIADRWAVVAIYALSRGPRRHGELGELIGGVSRKMLTQTLRRLERHGLVTRTAFNEVPLRVVYELTPLGRGLIEPIAALTRWAEENGEEVLAAQDRFEADLPEGALATNR
jgi:DNA-binding HxlR family transcriptional regulator